VIDQTNFETWFFMYADNELSAAEKLQVEEFVKSNPSLRLLLNQLCQLKASPDDVRFPDKNILYAEQMELSAYTFKPDYSVTYPVKNTLYRKSAVRKIKWVIPVSIAAGFIFILGLFVLLNPTEKSLTDEKLTVNKNISKPAPIELKEKPTVLAGTKPKIKGAYQVSNLNQPGHTSEIFIPETKQSVIVELEEEKSIESTPSPIIVQPNLSDEAIQAAASRNVEAQEIQSSNVTINTDILIQASNRNENHSVLRGLMRKITRRVFKEKSISDQQKTIQLSNFVIPVSNKQ
jgi:hypothetical protein